MSWLRFLPVSSFQCLDKGTVAAHLTVLSDLNRPYAQRVTLPYSGQYSIHCYPLEEGRRICNRLPWHELIGNPRDVMENFAVWNHMAAQTILRVALGACSAPCGLRDLTLKCCTTSQRL